MNDKLLVVLGIGLLIGGILIGYSVKEVPVQAKPEVITKTEIVYQEKIVEVPIKTELKDFQSVEELKEWLSGITIVSLKENMCGEIAIQLKDYAEKDGYYLSLQVIENGKIGGFKVSYVLIPHMGCMAVIDKDLYFIEPLTDEVTLFGKIR